MTLCIAWQDSKGVHMASDSRISSGGRYIDTGVKVFAVPVTIFPVRVQGEPEPSPLYRQVLGLCAAGSLISIYNVTEILRDVLQALYLTPWMSFASMDDLSNIVATFFENISRRVCEALASEEGAAWLVLAGFCHEQNRVRAFRLRLDMSDFPITTTQTELDLSAHAECFGSGALAAQRIFAATPRRHPLHVLKDVILDDAEPKVGGCVQFGEFKGEDFQTLGVEDYFIHPERQIEVGFFLRGVKVFDSLLQNWRSVTPRMLVVQPFTTQIEALLDQGYSPRQ